MPRLIVTENPHIDVRRYLRHWADRGFVNDQLRGIHPSLSADRRRTRANQVSRLIHQGLEFLASADSSTVLTKPLPLFYGAENLAKAACLSRDVALAPDDIRFHGLGGDRETKRYSIKNLSCRVHYPRKDVWSRFFRLFNSDRYQFEFSVDRQGAVTEQTERYATRPLKAKAEVALGPILRHLPELADDVRFAGWGHPYVVRAEGLRFTTRSGPPVRHSARFMLRHGHHAPTREMILDRESDLLRKFERVQDRLDVLEYRRDDVEGSIAVPNIRLDVFGDPWMDFARGVRVLGEPVLYFVALFILSDVARYQPEHWLRLLEDHPGETILIERFLDVAARKFPNLILSELNRQLFLFKSTR